MPNTFFTDMTLHRCVFPLRMRFAHNNATRDSAETLIVRIRARGGCDGYGQALPREYLTGESIDSAEADIRDRWWPAVRRMDIPGNADFRTLLAAFRPLFRQADSLRKNASYAAVECAAFDAALRASGNPAGTEESFAAAPLPVTGVIGATSPAKAFLFAGAYRAMGCGAIKVKVGRDAAADSARLRAVRKAAGSAARLLVDANGAWAPEEAEARMRGLAAFGVGLVEEPLMPAAAKGFDYLRLERETGVAVMADESVCAVDDAQALLEAGSPSWWNLRFAKNGGFCGLAALGALARDSGVSVHAGVLVGETGVLAAAGRAGAFLSGARSAEYGFSRVLLRGDPFRGSPAAYRGALPPPRADARGLGVAAKENALRKAGMKTA